MEADEVSGAGRGGATVLDRPAVEERRDEGDDELAGWYGVRTDPFPCPGGGGRCPFVANYLTAAHRIVVWPRMDDRALLTHARNARELGRNPRVVEYERSFGPAIAYDAWVAAGRPICGKLDEPEGWNRGSL